MSDKNNSNIKGKNNISRGLRFSNISVSDKNNSDQNGRDNRRFNNMNGNNVNSRLKNPGDNSSPNMSVPNLGSGIAKGNHKAVSLREYLKEGMKGREDREIRV